MADDPFPYAPMIARMKAREERYTGLHIVAGRWSQPLDRIDQARLETIARNHPFPDEVVDDGGWRASMEADDG